MANLRANRITSTEVFETTGSVQFDGSGDYLSVGTSSTFNYLHDRTEPNWTIEGWIYFKETGSYDALFGNNSGTAQVGIYLGKDISDRLVFAINKGTTGTTAITLTSTETFSSGQWYHIAVTNDNYLIKTFINGVNVNTGYWGSASTNDANTTLNIGRLGTSSVWDHNGHISNFRILKGTALYTTNFTPPTRELEVIPNTVLLCAQSTTNAAEEKTGKTITVNGNAVANELTPGLLTNVVKSGGSSAITGSVEFDGTGDYLSIPNTEDLRLNQISEDFTIECWVNTSRADGQFIVGLWETTNNRRSWILWFAQNSGPKPQFVWSTTGSNTGFITGNRVQKNEWYHIAVVKSSSTIKLYVNGIEEASDSSVTETFFAATTDNIQIGADWTNARYLQGFISNLRVIKGTALYTSDFIPPTRKLTKLPGTVLLCCQDSNDPTTEATGKTITGYGDLSREDVGVELVTNGTFGDGTTTGWVIVQNASLSVVSGRLRLTAVSNGQPSTRYTFTTKIGSTYLLKFDHIEGVNSGNAFLSIRNSNVTLVQSINIGSSSGTFEAKFVAEDTQTLIDLTGSSTWLANEYTDFDNISVTKLDPGNRASDFTPSVGSDGSVEFAGPTTINTENYFYLPTGPTEQRGRGRGVFGGGFTGSPSHTNTIDYITITSTGNAIDFGDLTESKQYLGGSSSTTRGIFGSGYTPSKLNTIEYITISSTGNSNNFGDLTEERFSSNSCSSNTRGVFGGGAVPSSVNTIDYVTIASTGDAQDFGDLTQERRYLGTCSSTTRGIFGGGYSTTNLNTIDYITISSTGNASDFGDLTEERRNVDSCSSSTRGVFSGGRTISNTEVNIIDYITISSTGNASDFGDLTEDNRHTGACSSLTRGVFGGGLITPNIKNTIDYVTISSTGNAQDFGDLTQLRYGLASCSDSHGGLG